MTTAASLKSLTATALGEMQSVIDAVDEVELDLLLNTIVESNKIVLFGVGREGLMMKALAMRLFHLGLDAHVLGDMTTPAIGKNDLFLVSAGPGYFSSIEALCKIAQSAGARVACVTANRDGQVSRMADINLILPAQTMADDQAVEGDPDSSAKSVLPMGSLYEGTQYLVFELLVLSLSARLNESLESMRSRHTNME